MPSSVSLIGLLKFSGALFWTLTYILIIWRASRDRAPGMPSLAVAGNVAVEATYGIWLRDKAPPHFPTVYLVWLSLDLVIVSQTLRYGPSYYRDMFPDHVFPIVFAGMLMAALVAVIAVTREFNDVDGRYSAFGHNVVMSSLFVARVINRRDVRGLSLYAGVTKLLGTLSFTLLFVSGWSHSLLVVCLGALSLCLDVAYVLLLHSRLRTVANPWRRL